MLSHYRLVEKIGEGGMGVVWKAEDTVLGRQVAIKVLPDDFVHDAERLARFRQEARLLASLNHPNIAAIHGLEESDGVRFLVLELVPGQTLAEQIARGSLSIEDALAVCRQIAEALEAAHERGIIHRDLKPGNVKVTPNGKVKVLDFGLAKAFEAEASGTDLTHSPTLTSPQTRAGILLGTAAYMSPEQARGRAVDRRADVWAFGCVLFEALAGRRAFDGQTITDILAAVVRAEPDWDALPGTLPAALRRLLRRCLEKDPGRRLRDLGDACLEIDEALSDDAGGDAPAVVDAAARGAGSRSRRLGRGVSTVLSVALVLALAALWQATRHVERPVRRLAVQFEDILGIGGNSPLGLAISPDGRRLAVVVRNEGTTRIVVRGLNMMEARPLPGTEGAASPFFSPDGEWIAFFSGGELRKIAVAGGSALTLAAAGQVTRGGAWTPDGTIVFAPTTTLGLMQVQAEGGDPRPLTTLDEERQERTHRWPQVLPGGEWVLFTVGTLDSPEYYEDSRIDAVSLRTGERREILRGASVARVTAGGHLVYAHEGNLFAQPFDLDKVRPAGPAVLVHQGIFTSTTSGAANFDASLDGTLAYVPGSQSMPENLLSWVERDGTSVPAYSTPGPFSQPALSPGGRHVAIVRAGGKTSDVWVLDLDRGSLSRLTFESNNLNPVWAPDGERVTFYSVRGDGQGAIIWKPADGSAGEEILWEEEDQLLPNSWSPDGLHLAVNRQLPDGTSDIWILPLENDRKPFPFVEGRSDEFMGAFSPDGRWLAYVSDETGRFEVYVRPFPGPGGRWQISTDGGSEPRWSAQGREIFFRNADQMLVAPVEPGPTLRAGTPRVLFEERFLAYIWNVSYDVAADGERLLMVQTLDESAAPDRVHLVLNWFEELNRLVPTESD
jgi:Tol biopolymer transport system component/tRNA A-37 threonylcarbamoyl transferase component Bud32